LSFEGNYIIFRISIEVNVGFFMQEYNNEEFMWQQFANTYALTEQQLQQFQRYYEMLCASNDLFNLTAMTELKSVIAYHFADSLELGKVVDLTKITMIADVGTGAGFPGMALKIKYPHLSVVLIEVNTKKVHFLESVAQALNLDIITYSLDWRTFLRKTTYPVQLVCARASLQPEELIRMFQPSCVYRNAELVYWAAHDWQPSGKVASLVRESFTHQSFYMKHKESENRKNHYRCHDGNGNSIFFNSLKVSSTKIITHEHRNNLSKGNNW